MPIFSPIDPSHSKKVLEVFSRNTSKAPKELLHYYKSNFIGNKNTDFYMGVFTGALNIFDFIMGIRPNDVSDNATLIHQSNITYALTTFMANKLLQDNIKGNGSIPHLGLDAEVDNENLKILENVTEHWASNDFQAYDNSFAGDKSLDFYKGLISVYLSFSTVFIPLKPLGRTGMELQDISSYLAKKILSQKIK